MVAPCPLEPLVLYLAATPHSASAALVAVRKERLSKKSQQDAQLSSKAQHPREDVSGASTNLEIDIPHEATMNPTAIKAPEDGPHEAMEDPCPHEEQDSADASPSSSTLSTL